MAETYQTDRRCGFCGSFERNVSNGNCAPCSVRRSFELQTDAQRKRAGLPPTKAGRQREEVRLAKASDRHLREIAQSTGESRYQSFRPCKRGHRAPERYTSTGGCVRCAAAASRRQYIPLRK